MECTVLAVYFGGHRVRNVALEHQHILTCRDFEAVSTDDIA